MLSETRNKFYSQDSYSGWQMGFSLFFPWIFKFCSFPLFSQWSSTRKESRGFQLFIASWGDALSLLFLHTSGPPEPVPDPTCMEGKGRIFTVKGREFSGRPEPHSRFKERKGLWTTLSSSLNLTPNGGELKVGKQIFSFCTRVLLCSSVGRAARSRTDAKHGRKDYGE